MIATAQKPSNPSPNRTQQQCDRILNAAEACFIKYGFHAASMANISETADMSPGLIYRYFENKSAIIKAIIERQLEIMRDDLSHLFEGADFPTLISEQFANWKQGNLQVVNPVLMLELTAEATRNPEIAEITGTTDSLCAEGIRTWLKQLAKQQGVNPSEMEIEQRHFTLRCFIDGLTMSAVRDPNLSPPLVSASLKRFLAQFSSFQH